MHNGINGKLYNITPNEDAKKEEATINKLSEEQLKTLLPDDEEINERKKLYGNWINIKYFLNYAINKIGELANNSSKTTNTGKGYDNLISNPKPYSGHTIPTPRTAKLSFKDDQAIVTERAITDKLELSAENKQAKISSDNILEKSRIEEGFFLLQDIYNASMLAEVIFKKLSINEDENIAEKEKLAKIIRAKALGVNSEKSSGKRTKEIALLDHHICDNLFCDLPIDSEAATLADKIIENSRKDKNSSAVNY